jgi:hypothetical protein
MNKPNDVVRCIASNADLDIYVRKPINGEIYTVYKAPRDWAYNTSSFNIYTDTCIKLHDNYLYFFPNCLFINISKERDEKLDKLLK